MVLSRLRVTFVSCMPTRELRYARRTREAVCLCSARISRGYKQYLVRRLRANRFIGSGDCMAHAAAPTSMAVVRRFAAFVIGLRSMTQGFGLRSKAGRCSTRRGGPTAQTGAPPTSLVSARGCLRCWSACGKQCNPIAQYYCEHFWATSVSLWSTVTRIPSTVTLARSLRRLSGGTRRG